MSRRSVQALLSVGSNLAPWLHVPRVLALLPARFGVVSVSPAYRCAAVGGDGPQPDFVNLAVRIDTDLPARALREACRRIEEQCERRRSADRYAPRTMDLDVVLIPEFVRVFEDWALPAPELLEHPFVLVPCADAWPEAVHPVRGTSLAELAAALPTAARQTLRPLGEGGLDALRKESS